MPSLGLGLSLSRSSFFFGGFTSEAKAFFAAAEITDANQKLAINQLVIDLQVAALWNEIEVLYPFVGGTAEKHSYNLKDPTEYQITWVGSVTHDANGITGDASTGYGDSNMPRNTCPQSLAHMAAYVRVYGATDFRSVMGVDNFGASAGSVQFSEIQHFFGSVNGRMNGVEAGGGATALGTPGFVICTREVGDLDTVVLTDGSTFTGQAEVAAGTNLAHNVFILAVNRNGSAVDLGDSNIALVSCGNSFTLAQSIAYRSIIQAYQTTLNRNV